MVMDLTKKYIKMCKEAVKFISPDEFLFLDLNIYYNNFTKQIETGYIIRNQLKIKGYLSNQEQWDWKKYTILFTQDQLQEMLNIKDKIKLIFSFYNFLQSKHAKSINNNSMEQNWLEFVMKEKYKKIWKNDKWK